MANINKIKLSGTTYNIQDLNASKTVELTQAQYDALVSGGTVDPNTFYVITDAQGADLSNYYTKSETSGATQISTALSGKQDTLISGTNIKTINNTSILGSGNIEIQGGGSTYTAGAGIDITNDVISVTGKVDTTAFTAHTADTVIHVTSAEKAAWNTKSDFSGDYNDLTNKPTIPTVPTSNTAFTNDAGYITSDAISGKADTSAVTESINAAVSGKVDTSTFNTYSGSIETALSGKQDTLSAGTGISIVDNVISATGGGGGGGMTEDDELLLSTALVDLNERKIDASEVNSNYQKKGDYVTINTLNTRLADYETALDEQNVEEVTAYALNDLNYRFGGLKIVKITESEYEALTTKDDNTLYIVVADPS